MIRSTTPRHTFVLPFSYNENVSKCTITYKQFNTIVLEKDETQVTVDPDNDKSIWVKLTQAETKMFKPDIDVFIQLKVLLNDGNVLASNVYSVFVYDVLNDSELHEEE